MSEPKALITAACQAHLRRFSPLRRYGSLWCLGAQLSIRVFYMKKKMQGKVLEDAAISKEAMLFSYKDLLAT